MLVCLLLLRIRASQRRHRLCKEQSFGIQAALWAAHKNQEQHMKHWLQLVATPNSSASSNQQQMQDMKKRISDLDRAHRARIHRSKQQFLVRLSMRFQLLQHPLTVQKEVKEATTKRGERETANLVRLLRSRQVVPRTSTILCFQKKEICYAFQKKSCDRKSDGKWAHICIG